MLKNFFKVALRSLLKHPGFTAINIIGLAIGITSSVLILLFVRNELSYDKHNVHAENIYRIGIKGSINSDEINGAVACNPMGPALVQDYPFIKNYVRLYTFGGDPLVQYEENKFVENDYLYADSTFFDVFTAPMIKGNPKTALSEPNTLVMTESTAQRYFGDDEPIDKVVLVGNSKTAYTVTGVIQDPPVTSHFHYDILASYVSHPMSRNTFWVSNNLYVYLLLEEGTTEAQLDAVFPEVIKKYVGPQIEAFMGKTIDEFTEAGNSWGYTTTNIRDIHLRSEQEFEMEPGGNIASVYIFSIVAIFLIAIAGINFMNLATARSANRAKEVGVKKVVGSNRSSIIRQFLTESVLLSFIATAVSFLLVQLLLPHFNNLATKSLVLNYISEYPIFLAILFIGIIVGLLAGLYPAFFLSAFNPSKVLKGELSAGAKSSRFRGILVILQFVITIVLFISTIVVSGQMRYIQNKDLGFDSENLIVVHRAYALGEQLETFKNELTKNSFIKAASATSNVPGETTGSNAFYPENSTMENTRATNFIMADRDYGNALGLRIKYGRLWTKDIPSDTAAVVVNEAMIKAWEYENNPIGRKIKEPAGENGEFIEYTIIGVVEDFNYESLHKNVRPLIIQPMRYFESLAVKIDPGTEQAAISEIKSLWNEMVIDQPLDYAYLEEQMQTNYNNEERTEKIFSTFAILAIFIACLGLLGLSSFMAEQRTKEVGVRKAMGASVLSVMRLLLKEIVLLVGISSLIAWPLSYYLMNKWLQDFAYKMSLNLWFFVMASVAAFAIAIITVGFQAYRAASANPTQALKYE